MPDLSQYGTVSAPSAAAPDLDLSKYGSVAEPAKAAGAASRFGSGLYDTTLAPLVHLFTTSPVDTLTSMFKGVIGADDLRTIAATAKSGDYAGAAALTAKYITTSPGERIAKPMVDSVVDSARSGDYAGAAGKVTGDALTLGIPVLQENGAFGAAADAVAGAGRAVIAKLPDSIPVVPGAVADTAGIAHPPLGSAIRLYNRAAKTGNKIIDAMRTPEASPAADAPVAAAAPARTAAAPASTIVPPEGSFVSRSDAIPSEHGVLPPLERSQFFRPIAENGAVDLSGYGSVAPARESPVAAPAPEPSPAPAPEAPSPAPALDPARAAQQRIEDAADEQAARMRAHAEDIEWANRAHRADRFAAYMLRNGVEPTPVNLAAAARDMGEKGGPPSDETVPMIWDRMNYHPEAAEEATRSRLAETLTPPAGPAAPAATEEAPTELEQNLQASIDAANARKAAPPAASGAQPAEGALRSRLVDTLTPAPGSIAQVDPNTIKADPVRFQFKRDTGGVSGTGDKLKDLNTYNPDLGGMLNVWRDPADGQTYVVNGHHRLELAQRTGTPSVDIRYIDAADAREARAKGALINIAEDQGTPLDAAKLFRDTNITPADLRAQGIALNGRIARAGLGLSNLSQQLFDGVVAGDIPSETGSAIGELLAGKFADQSAVMEAVKKAAARGKPMTPAQIAESIRVGMRPGNEVTEMQDTLFGSVAETRNLFAETGELSDYVRKQLASEKRLFGAVSSAQSADTLSGAGNTINAGENSRIAGETSQAQQVYDKLSGMSGPVSDAIAAGARELASGAGANEVKARTYAAVRKAISDTLPRTQEGIPGGPAPGDSGGVSQASGTPSRARTPKVTSKRIKKIGDLGALGGQ